MSDEKQELIKQQQVGDALKEMRNHQGWAELTNILGQLYVEGLESLIAKESVEVRARLQAIQDIAEQIKLKIEFAEVAAKELKAKKFTIMQDTP